MSDITPLLQLEGAISGIGSISGIISGMGDLSGSISSQVSEYDEYTGPYDVEPRKAAQVLSTSDKLLLHDVEVSAIHYSEVTNPEGGLTINIGYE